MPKPAKHPAYVAWLHDQPCCVTGLGGVVSHHLTRLGPMKRITRNDRYMVPLRPEVHNMGKYAVHDMGVTAFEAHWGVDLTALAEFYWNKWERENAS